MKELLEYCVTENQRRAVEAYLHHGNQRAAAKELGIGLASWQRTIERIKKRYAKSNAADLALQSRSPVDGFTTKRVSTAYKEDGTVALQWHIQEPDKQTIEEQLKDLAEALSEDIKKIENIPAPKRVQKELMNNIVIGDPHLDMLSYAKETGADWDINIACEQHMRATLGLLKRAPEAAVGMLTILGDSLHRDSMKALTPGSGNLVDVDGRVSRSIKYATKLFRAMIVEMLKTHKKVVVAFIRGNHSETLELCLRDMLDIAFEANKRVEVLDNTSKHIPYQFGKNFLLMTHGDRLSEQKKADIAVSMYRDYHGSSKFTHVLSGHVHHANFREVSGCFVETFQALPTPDAWHAESGFVTSDQSVSMLTYHVEGGIVSRLNEYPRIFMEQKKAQ